MDPFQVLHQAHASFRALAQRQTMQRRVFGLMMVDKPRQGCCACMDGHTDVPLHLTMGEANNGGIRVHWGVESE